MDSIRPRVLCSGSSNAYKSSTKIHAQPTVPHGLMGPLTTSFHIVLPLATILSKTQRTPIPPSLRLLEGMRTSYDG